MAPETTAIPSPYTKYTEAYSTYKSELGDRPALSENRWLAHVVTDDGSNEFITYLNDRITSIQRTIQQTPNTDQIPQLQEDERLLLTRLGRCFDHTQNNNARVTSQPIEMQLD